MVHVKLYILQSSFTVTIILQMRILRPKMAVTSTPRFSHSKVSYLPQITVDK